MVLTDPEGSLADKLDVIDRLKENVVDPLVKQTAELVKVSRTIPPKSGPRSMRRQLPSSPPR